jgi:hypothetical protein
MLLNPLSWFVTTREKVLAAAAYTLLIVWGGWHLHTMWDVYINEGNVKSQLERAKEAPAAISKFNQALRKTHVEKTQCFDTPIPNDVLDLLR